MEPNTPFYRTARALYPHRPDLWDTNWYLYEPPPAPPADHPELALFENDGLTRIQVPLESAIAEDETPLQGAPVVEGSAIARRPGRLDEPMPARMLNEFVYCPRLFFYEYVEGVFVESADTERGQALHKRVDKGRGDLPAARKGKTSTTVAPQLSSSAPSQDAAEPSSTVVPSESNSEFAAQPEAEAVDAGSRTAEPKAEHEGEPEPEQIHSRSVSMGSDRLGVVAKMDLVEVRMAEESRTGVLPLGGPADILPADTQPNKKGATTGTKRQRVALPEPDLFRGTPPPPLIPPEPRRVAGSVTPVDYKAGAPKPGADENELWDADKMQLGLQILVLRDNGYVCDEGVIYYRATKQRVRLAMTEELETWIVGNIAKARALAESGTIPPPLVCSPKCVRCSLAPVCLPDETRLLQSASQFAERSEAAAAVNRGPQSLAPPRRLIAPRDECRALYLNTQGVRVTKKGEVLTIKEGEHALDEVRMLDVTHVALFGNIQISTQALQALCEAEIPVAYFSMGGWFYGLTRGHGLANVFTRIEQFRQARDERTSLDLARRFVNGKIRNQRTLLMRLHIEPPAAAVAKLKRAADDALGASSIAELLGIEGAAAAMYFQNFAGMIKVAADDDDIPGLDAPARSDCTQPIGFTFDFTKRTRRPPTDPVNAMLSLAYSLLAKDCTIAVLAVGFDPYVGFYHQPRFGRPALALDLMEEFRPLVAESAVLTAINNRMINDGHFVRAGEAVNLTPAGRKNFFQCYEQRMNSLVTHPVFDYKASYRRILELQARLLARRLTGEIADYIPMVTR